MARVDVPWWPAAAGARTLRVEASHADGEVETFDNAIDVAVDVAAGQIPVLVFDARPSWGGTFVRRALEDDARFAVEYRARIAPAVTGGTQGGRLDADVLDRIHVLIIGGPDALTGAERSLIDRFVRVRGGTAIVLPDRLPMKAEAALIPGEWTEQLSAEPRPVGPLRSSERLQLAGAPLGSVIAGDGARPVIVEFPVGAGAIIVSGAMDAWRHRDGGADSRPPDSPRQAGADFSPPDGSRDPGPGSAFDAFWRSLAMQAAAVSGSIRIDLEPGPLLPGTTRHFTARARSMHPRENVEASAVLQCGASKSATVDAMARAVRMWPAGSAGAWSGELIVPPTTGCALEVRIGEAIGTTALAISESASRPAATELDALTRGVARAGGAVTTMEAVGGALPVSRPRREQARVYPLRSPWWILPFAICLSAEWWSRRRSGLA
jgi:hypothetical protein